MKRVANYCLILLVCSVLFAIGCWGGKNFLNGLDQIIAIGVISIFTLFDFSFVIYLGLKVFHQYKDDVRI